MGLAPLLRRARRVFVPLIAVAVMAYTDYVACFVVAWKIVYPRHPAGAIVFWVLLGSIQATHLFYWARIFIRGPGEIPILKHFDLYGTNPAFARVPDAFICDEQGFPFWCSRCENLKPDRSFHLTDLDACVPKFDHYCLWVGTAIGRNNYLPFVRFVQLFGAYSILVVCFTATYTRVGLHEDSTMLPHYIVLYIVNVFAMIMTVALFGEAARAMFTNSTALDEITRRQAVSYRRWTSKQAKSSPRSPWCTGKIPRVELGLRYINVAHEGTRKVVCFGVNEHAYSNGFRVNLINTCLRENYSLNLSKNTIGDLIRASVVGIIPYSEFVFRTAIRRDPAESFEGVSDEFSRDFMQSVFQKIENGQYKVAGYLPAQAQHKELSIES